MYTFEDWDDELASIEDDELRATFIFDTLRDKYNLHIFGRLFFPHIIRGKVEVPDCHKELIAEVTSDGDSAIIFPRGFAKSTWLKIDALHDIVYNLEPVIVYVSNTLTDAQFHFESMKVELENNQFLREIYGNLVPGDFKESKKWTNKHFETLNGVNMIARGANKGRGINIKNQRPTKIIIDDVEDDELVRSADRRQKLQYWLYNVIFPSKDKERGRIKMVGTVLHEKCEVLSFYNKHGGIFKQATTDGALTENSVSIWPQMWSIQDLIDQKETVGTRAFMQEYMNQPTNEELANFKASFIDEHTYVLAPAFVNIRKIINFDPQAGESSGADEYALTVLGWEWKDTHRYVLEQQAGHASQMEQAVLVVKAWKRHPEAHIVAVEKVLNQTAVWQIIRDWKVGRINFNDPELDNGSRDIPLVAYSPVKSGSTKGIDKLGRLQMQEPSFERGEVHIHHTMNKLREQILFLGSNLIEHDDRADSLIGALEQSYQGEYVEKEEAVETKQENVYNGLVRENPYKTSRKRMKGNTIAGNLFKMKF